jgi:hypothetical protein
MAMGDYKDPYEGLPRRSLFTSVVDGSKPSRVLGYDLPAIRALPEPAAAAAAAAERKAAKLVGSKKGRGRPAVSKKGAMTAAEKQAAYRLRLKLERERRR